ncbi:MAG: CCA tRNA nucleotidyltransferase [candidate division WOR-3 bacterium]|nr:MAG: CCA tRNA nucleotidyltransferase [candidate division WOR-3 bacterium]
MKKVEEYVRNSGAVAQISRLGKGRDLYLVGGTVRDILLDIQPRDHDFAVSGPAMDFARSVAREIRGAYVLLDESADEARVVKDELICDFIGLDERGIIPDLKRRDFTINAMAVNIKDLAFFDPCGGARDIRKRIIRPTSPDALITDPLRILRGFRFAIELKFNLHRDFDKLARNITLEDVAAERVGEELMRIMSHCSSFETILRINSLGIFKEIFPEAHKLLEDFDLWNHSLNTYGAVENLIGRGFFKKLQPEYSSYFAEPNRVPLCKLAGLLHDVAKPDTLLVKEGEVHFYGHDTIGARMIEKIAHRRLRLSRHDTDVLKKLVKEHMRLHLLATNPELTDRAIRRFFRHLEVDWFGAMIIAWADGYATGGKTKHLEKAFTRMVALHRADMAKPRVERLVTGHDLIALGMKPGPAFKTILQELLDLQLEGEIEEKSDALNRARMIAARLAEGGNTQ